LKVVIDSSVLISIFSQNDKFHKLALKIIEKLRASTVEIYVPSLALPEVCGGITRITRDRKEGEAAKGVIQRWIDSGFFTMEELTKDRMLGAANFAIEFKVRGADAIFSSLALEKGAQLITFDEELKKKIKRKIKLFEL